MAYYCSDCPRKCSALRPDTVKGCGFCGCGDLISVAGVMAHKWEEPVLCGDTFTDNIFFYGCNLRCVYCQNYRISSPGLFPESKLKVYDDKAFGARLAELDTSPGKTIGLVTGDHFARQIARAITPDVKSALTKPLGYNCSGYQSAEALRLLEGRIDIFMPDFKYIDSRLAAEYSHAADYPEAAKAFIAGAFEAVGPASIRPDGIMEKGLIIRHLILPGAPDNTLGVIDFINSNFRPGEIVFSLMSQYVPVNNTPAANFPKLARKVSGAEHRKAAAYLAACDNITEGFTQDVSSASGDFIPDFENL